MSDTFTVWLGAKEQEYLLKELRAHARAPPGQALIAGKFSTQASLSLEEFVNVREVWMI